MYARRTAILQFLLFTLALTASGCGKPPDTTISPPITVPSTPRTLAAPVTDSSTLVRSGSALLLARKYLSQTRYMTVAELEKAILAENPGAFGRNGSLKPNVSVVIPELEPQPVHETPRKMPRESDLRAIYLTGTMAGSVRGLDLIRKWKELGGNAVVFDIKDSDGLLQTPFIHPLAPKNHTPISNLPKFVRYLHSLDLHAIARIALFRDEHIARQHPELAIHSRATGAVWLENGKQVWTDPSHPAVQEYDLALAKYVAQSGADEIQFDYVRFPAEGDQQDARFRFEELVRPAGAPKPQRREVIAGFLQQAYAELHPLGVLVSVDVFGVMAWRRAVDLAHTGQDVALMARFCDVLSPMIYPSHFYGMDGYALPGEAPEHFIASSMDRFRSVTSGTGVVLRPWLQAFAWKTPSYSSEYIKKQVAVAKRNGGTGFLLWNARNDYSKPFAAMPAMRQEASTYFGRSEPAKTVASAVPAMPGAAPRPAADEKNLSAR